MDKIIRVRGVDYLVRVKATLGNIFIAPAVVLPDGSAMWEPEDQVRVIPLDRACVDYETDDQALSALIAVVFYVDGVSADVAIQN